MQGKHVVSLLVGHAGQLGNTMQGDTPISQSAI